MTRCFDGDTESIQLLLSIIGVAIMCKAMEEMRNETNRETKKGIAVELIKEGTLSLDKIAAVCNLTVEEVKELTMQPA